LNCTAQSEYCKTKAAFAVEYQRGSVAGTGSLTNLCQPVEGPRFGWQKAVKAEDCGRDPLNRLLGDWCFSSIPSDCRWQDSIGWVAAVFRCTHGWGHLYLAAEFEVFSRWFTNPHSQPPFFGGFCPPKRDLGCGHKRLVCDSFSFQIGKPPLSANGQRKWS
jgi:hypothetical protein